MPLLAAATRFEPVSAVATATDKRAEVSRFFRQLSDTDRVLTATGMLMLALLVPAALGLWLDPRLITGAPAWLKPAKFAISTAIYAFTLAWVFRYLPDFPRTRRVVGRVTSAIFVVEVGIIYLQAWRGTTSHFNIGTPLDAVLFGVMGLGIAVQTVASVAVAVALWRQPFSNRALGWALRFGMIITIVGASVGGMMTRPTAAQLAAAHETQAMPVAGAHTVGAADGGPGLPGTGWSTAHGDLRVPHFFGLHALQLLPLITLVFRRQSANRRVQLTWLAASAYAAVFALLLVQALRGLPFVSLG